MKKLALNIDEIEVESFDTLKTELRRGTVAAREDDSAMGTGCNTDDMCCQANTIGGEGGCGSSGDCDDLSVCWGGMC